MLFARFRDDPETEDWIVLHSLDIARHVKQIEGEADFVILIPDHGVLCLEVKAGDVRRQDGVWQYKQGVDVKESRRSPFKQASEAMHSLRNYIGGQNALLKNILFISAVAFTRVAFDESSPEWHRWQFVDRTEISRRPVSQWCVEILQRAHRHVSAQARAGWYDPTKAKPSRKQIEAIAELLRPDFEYFRLPKEEAEELDREIKRYTEDQFVALDAVEENHRTLFKGLAGTGKTLIALEAARRALTDRKRVLFVCFNHLLGDWLRHEVALLATETGGAIECGTLHSVLLRTAGTDVPEGADSEYWRQDLPVAAIDAALGSDDGTSAFDLLIVDECQDFNEDVYFDYLDLRLKGGLSAGKWIIFGDFDRQAIYGKTLDIPALLRQRGPDHAVFRLTSNCRNTYPIAMSVEALCTPDPRYKQILHLGKAAQTDVYFYGDQADQESRLKTEIEKLLKILDPSDIAVLSVRGDRNSTAAALASNSDLNMRPFSASGPGKGIRFGSIHAFKGLESAAVVITDIDSISSDHEQSLLYVGMTRARQRLVLLLNKGCKEDYEAALIQSLTRERRDH